MSGRGWRPGGHVVFLGPDGRRWWEPVESFYEPGTLGPLGHRSSGDARPVDEAYPAAVRALPKAK